MLMSCRLTIDPPATVEGGRTAACVIYTPPEQVASCWSFQLLVVAFGGRTAVTLRAPQHCGIVWRLHKFRAASFTAMIITASILLTLALLSCQKRLLGHG